MGTYVYADIILIENFLMNYIIIWSSSRYLRIKHTKLKFAVSSLIGALYAVLSYFPQFTSLYSINMKILLSLLMVIVAFTPSTLKEFIRYTGLFYLVSFIFGGAAFGFYYFIRGLKSTVNGVSYISKFPVIILLLSISIAYVIVKYCWEFIQYRIRRDKVFIELSICMDSKEACMMALVDTGNALNDPISKSYVIVAEYEAIRDLFPLEIQKIFEGNHENDLNVLTMIMSCSEWVTRFRVIPFKSLGRENGMLIGFKPDEVHITEDNKKIQVKNTIIGVYNKKLSSGNEYFALVHPDVFCSETEGIKAS